MYISWSLEVLYILYINKIFNIRKYIICIIILIVLSELEEGIDRVIMAFLSLSYITLFAVMVFASRRRSFG